MTIFSKQEAGGFYALNYEYSELLSSRKGNRLYLRKQEWPNVPFLPYG